MTSPTSLEMMVLALGSTRVAFAQQQVVSLASAAAIEDFEPAPGVMGWTEVDGKYWPVYALDEGLRPLPRRPATRRICVLIFAAGRGFGLLCDRAHIAVRETSQLLRVPAAEQQAGSPGRAVFQLRDSEGAWPALLLSAAQLATNLGVPESRPVPALEVV